MDEFREEGEVYVATEDGSAGTEGNVLDAIRENGLKMCIRDRQNGQESSYSRQGMKN